MRISNKQMAENLKHRLFQQTARILESETKVTTGKRVNKLSDDPVAMGRILEYRSTISRMEQYGRNISLGQNHLEAVDGILEAVSDLIGQAKDIASNPDPDLSSSQASQVADIRRQILQFAGSKHNGNYLFSGHQTDTAPFDSSGTYQGDSGTRDIVIGQGMTVSIEADGSEIFQGSQDVFQVLDDLETAIGANDKASIKTQLSRLQDALEHINGIRAENAVQAKRMETAENHWNSFRVSMEQMLSRTEDADLAEAVIDLQVQKTAYEASLATGAMIIQPSLVDFLS